MGNILKSYRYKQGDAMLSRRVRLLALALAILVFAAGCASGAPQVGEGEGLVVCTTVYPLWEFAGQIAGERAEVVLLTPDGGELHDWEPTPADMVILENCNLLVYNGAGLEHWTDAALSSVQGGELAGVDTSAGLELLEGEAHVDHGPERDPHVWLSPANAAVQARAIRDGLIGVDPQGEAAYTSNCDVLLQRLEQLDQQFRTALEPLPGRDIVVAHAAFGYLCRDYGLNQIAVQGFSPDGEPDPAAIARVIDLVREHRINVIFFEEQASGKVAQIIANEVGVGVDALNPLETLTAEQKEAGEDYFSVMESNLEALVAALSNDPAL